MQIGKDVLGSEMSYDCGLIVSSTRWRTCAFYDHPLHVAVAICEKVRPTARRWTL
ncbi:MAG: hypothetical protein ACLUFV_01155 [Acutalibacteraceae bacterium]